MRNTHLNSEFESRCIYEDLYSTAYAHYETECYEDAAKIFTRLVLFDPFDERFWRGLAATHQMMNHYLEALHSWAMVTLLAEEDPLPHFHAAECYFCMENREEALIALDAAGKKETIEEHLHQKIQQLKVLCR